MAHELNDAFDDLVEVFEEADFTHNQAVDLVLHFEFFIDAKLDARKKAEEAIGSPRTDPDGFAYTNGVADDLYNSQLYDDWGEGSTEGKQVSYEDGYEDGYDVGYTNGVADGRSHADRDALTRPVDKASKFRGTDTKFTSYEPYRPVTSSGIGRITE